MEETYEVFALKYAERSARTRADSFLFDDDHAAQHDMDYFVWVIQNGNRRIVVDTGYDAAEGARRGRAVLRDPGDCLRDFGIDPATVDTVVVTHLHYDHAGCLDRFANARFHLQAAEMAFATGPCMCHAATRMPFTADHVCAMVQRVYSGRVEFHSGDGQVAPGVEVVAIGGHSPGLQAVRVKTARGWLILASDASHYYENFLSGKLFPIVVDAPGMLDGFETLKRLGGKTERIIPGHDPLVRRLFPRVAGENDAVIHRLDVEPLGTVESLLKGGTT